MAFRTLSFFSLLFLGLLTAWSSFSPEAQAQRTRHTLELDAETDQSKSTGGCPLTPYECAEQEYQSVYSELDPANWSTGILRERILTVYPLGRYDGSGGDTTYTKDQWLSMYDAAYRSAAATNGMVAPSTLKASANATASDVAPVAITFLGFNTFDNDAYDDYRLDVNTTTNKVVRGPSSGSPYASRPQIFFSAQSLRNPVDGPDVTFDFDSQYFTTNRNVSISSLEVDFGDGMGFRSVSVGSRVNVSYADLTDKTVTVRAEISRVEQEGSFVLSLRQKSLDRTPDSDITNTNAVANYEGVSVGYEYHGFYGSGNSSIEKPVIFLDGFDPQDQVDPAQARGLSDIYDLLNEEVDINGETLRAANTLRSEGHDLFILNYKDGGRSITENAFALVDLLSFINQRTGGSKAVTVIGPSMGGLVSRYALLYMEENNIAHNVKLWVSFDSPHQGANVPIGLQKLTKKFPLGVGPIKNNRKQLSLPAARELMAYNAFNGTGESDPLRQNLLNALESMGGYPSQPRRVAIANGNGYGDYQVGSFGQNLYPGEKIFQVELLDTPFPLPYEYQQNVFAAPNDQNGKIFSSGHYLKIDLIFGEIRIKVGGIERYADTLPLDSAPGGTRPFTADSNIPSPMGGILGGDAIQDIGFQYLAAIAGVDTEVFYPRQSFIPTVSALDYNTSYPNAYSFGNQDLFHDVMNDSDSEQQNRTPFDRIYAHQDDTPHVDVTGPSYQILLDEIRTLYGPDYLVLENETVSTNETYVASKKITAGPTFTLASSASVDLRAGDRIVLRDGFHAESGSEMHAYIGTALEPTPMTVSPTLLASKSDASTTSPSDDATTASDASDAAASAKTSALTPNVPDAFALNGNYPNPFRGQTTLRYALPEDTRVTLTVYNLLGQRVSTLIDKRQPAGTHTLQWDAGRQASGTYLVRMQAGSEFQATRKMMLVR